MEADSGIEFGAYNIIWDQHLQKEEWSKIGQREKLNDNTSSTKSVPNQQGDVDLPVSGSHIGLQRLDIHAHTSPEMGFSRKDMTSGKETIAEADSETFDSWEMSTDYTFYFCDVQEVLLWRRNWLYILCLPLICPRIQQLSQ